MTRRDAIGSPALFWWGVLGVIAILGNAIVRLTPLALHPIRTGTMGAAQWAVAIPWLVAMVWMEGINGFHRRFSPRVVVRARQLAHAPLWVRVMAPLASMGLLWGTRRRMIGSWMLVLGIVGLIVMVHQVPQPWRGVIDLGVVAGLLTGTLSVLWHAVRAAQGVVPDVDPELPPGVQAA